MKVRATVIALSGSALILLFSGCSGGADSQTLATTVAPGAVFSDAEFVGVVREDDGGYFDGKPDSEIFEAAEVVCGTFTPSKGGDADTQYAATLKAMLAMGFDAKAAGGFMVYATAQRCLSEVPYLNAVYKRATGG